MEKERTQKRQAEFGLEMLDEELPEELFALENTMIQENNNSNAEKDSSAQKLILTENLSMENSNIKEENAEISSVKIPKNVRQIGNIDKKSRIYIEDYVVTYLKRFRSERKHPFGAAALFGKVAYVNGAKYVFIAGAAYRETDDNYEDGVTEDMLLYYKECGQNYFQDYTGVGIAVIHDGNIRIPVKWHQKINLAGLVGRGEVFIDINYDEEEEEYAFVHDDGIEIKEGHYIYYDKNEAMQSFLVDWHEKGQFHEPEEDRDEVVSESCRIVLDDKKENRRMSFATFCTSASSIILLAGMCIVGINMLNHGQEVSSGQVQISTISQEDALDLVEAIQVVNAESEEEQMGMSLDDFINNQAGEVQNPATMETETMGEKYENVDRTNSNEEYLNHDNTKQELNGMEITDSQQSGSETDHLVDNRDTVPKDNVENSIENNIADNIENHIADKENPKEEVENNGNNEGVKTNQEASEQRDDEENMSESDGERSEIQETVGQADRTFVKYTDYKIKKGDTLYEICMKRYGSISKLQDICSRNDIEDQDSIYYGQIIELPEE